MKLFGYWRSSSSWRVRIALHTKGVAFENVPVHLVRGGGEQLATAHRARNPMGQVPVLQLEGGTTLAQSMAILEYLEERYPEPPLLPGDTVGRARVRELAELVNSGIQPIQNLTVLNRVTALGGDRGQWALTAIREGFDALELRARDTSGTCLVGDQVTFADCMLIPQLYNARRFQLSLEPYPTLTRVEAHCASLPAFVASHPDVQPDANA